MIYSEMSKHGKCDACGKDNTGWNYCQPCQAKIFEEKFSQWSSGDDEIDQIIRSSQLNAKNEDEVINWVLFSEFRDKKIIYQSGFGLFYKATWKIFRQWNLKTKVAERKHYYYYDNLILKYTTLPNLYNEVCYHCVAFLILTLC